MGRYIFTGAPGAGKTALLDALAGVGYPVVREICTLALARYSDRPVPIELSAEVDRLVRVGFYEPNVFLVRPLGFIERTAARRITYEDSLLFEAVHESTYTSLGFNLVEVLPGSIDSRVARVRDTIEGYAAGRA